VDPTTFQTTMKDLCDVAHANSIFQHFTTAFIEFNMHLVPMRMIATTIVHMD
jgi:hypothetical protein